MPDPRNTDFLRQHARLDQRVSNIETGVHPTKADVVYEDVGAPVDTGGGDVDLTGYLHYGLNDDDALSGTPPIGFGQSLTIQTTDAGVTLISRAGTTLRIDQNFVPGVKLLEVIRSSGTTVFEITAGGQININGPVYLFGLPLATGPEVQAMIDAAIAAHHHDTAGVSSGPGLPD